MFTRKIVLCTGANQGLGFAIIQGAATQDPTAVYILASRNLDAGKRAAEKLANEGTKATIEVIQLDITKDEHVIAAVKFVEERYGKLDVLINNAGSLIRPTDDSLPALREAYNSLCNLHISSVAVITTAFRPLLYKSASPRVINITSGLGSITNTLTKKMGRFPPYGASKVGLNGLTAHMQVVENDRLEEAEAAAKACKGDAAPRISYYCVAPGVLKTAFANFPAQGRDPREGAEAVLRLISAEEGVYAAGTHWQFERGEMRVVPW